MDHTPDSRPDAWETTESEPTADAASEPTPAFELPRPRHRRKAWHVPAIAAVAGGLVVGGLVGVISEGKLRDWEAHSSGIASARDAAILEREEIQAERDGLLIEIEGLEARNKSLADERDTERQKAAEAEKTARAREAEHQTEAQTMREQEAALKEREAAVAQTEKQVAESTITEGMWTVGRDIKPGTYVTTSAVTRCYWAILESGSNGDDIIQNDIVTGGRPTVTLSEGQDFKSSRCGSWALQG